MKLYKYHGAGNDFLIGDNRKGEIRLDDAKIIELCDRHYGIGADGLILLENSSVADFKMVFYNSDASRGMMCGNGGRCIISFAKKLGFNSFNFEAADGLHSGKILSKNDIKAAGLKIPYDSSNPKREIVKLEMRDVTKMLYHPEIMTCLNTPIFMNTGSRHLVIQTECVDKIDINKIAPGLRYDTAFEPYGTNVNFIEVEDENSLFIRSYEKGVEGETFACGTGAIASSIAFRHYQSINLEEKKPLYGEVLLTNIRTLKENLAVEITLTKEGANGIHIIGPSTFVYEVNI